MIRIRDARFTYPGGGFSLTVDALDVEAGGKLCITGRSGSGKTTLIQLISGILKADEGSIEVAGLEIARRNEKEVRRFRLHRMGFIFQDFELLEYLTVEQNILLPYLLDRKLEAGSAVKERLDRLLERTGLQDKARVHPGRLSHGEKQRVAVMRALITDPDLVIGDEPTANLDEENADAIMDLIFALVKEQKSTFVLVTHDMSLAGRFEQRFEL
jgi:putative ABC transport system ATP-binding protein